jgi:UDP-N-acetyl-D-mannosaminuronate dehydrogenase
VILFLARCGAVVTCRDPHVPELKLDRLRLTASLEEAAAGGGCVVTVTDHEAFGYPALAERVRLIVEMRIALKGIRSGMFLRL